MKLAGYWTSYSNWALERLLVEVILTAIFDCCASEMSSDSVDLCMMTHLDSPQFVEMPKGLPIPSRSMETAVVEESVDFAQFYNFVDAASENDVGSSMFPWRLVSEECVFSVAVIYAASTVAEEVAFEIAEEIESSASHL